MDGTRQLVVIDPVTGLAVPDLNSASLSVASSIVGDYHGALFFSGKRSNWDTEVGALDLASGEFEVIGRIDASASVQGISPKGDALFLTRFDDSEKTVPPRGDITRHVAIAAGLLSVKIPERWRQTAMPRQSVMREMMGNGILSRDGRRWFHLTGLGQRGFLHVVEFGDGEQPEITRLSIPSEMNYFALLAGPDDHMLYVVDYRSAMTIHVVDGLDKRVLRSVAAWEDPYNAYGTKSGPCGAVLTPDGERLYVVGREGPGGGGIDVIAMDSLTVVEHLLDSRPVNCLVMSSDGRTLYFTPDHTGYELTTIDLRTGEERNVVEVGAEGYFTPLLSVRASG